VGAREKGRVMDETQLALEMAKLAAEVKLSSIWSDFIKIGAPSAVAIVTAIFSYCLSVKNSEINLKMAEQSREHEEKIERMKIKHDRGKITDGRIHKLLLDISSSASEMFNYVDNYMDNLAALKFFEDDGSQSPALSTRRANNLHSGLSSIVTDCNNKIIPFVLIVGDDELFNKYNDFYDSALTIISEFTPFCDYDYDVVSDKNVAFKTEREAFFDRLSKLFKDISRINEPKLGISDKLKINPLG